jgi:hypothetical protein
LGGLKDNIRLPVRMCKPQTLLAAYGLAKVQEERVLTERRYRNVSGNFVPRSGAFGNQNFAIRAPKAIIPVQKISQAQMEDRRKK